MTSKTVNALQKLYIENGGNITDVQNINTIPDMILKLATLDINASQTANILSNSEENEEIDENIMNSLKNLYNSYGGNSENLDNINNYADLILEIGNAKTIYNNLTLAIKPRYSGEVYDVDITNLQTSVKFHDKMSHVDRYITELDNVSVFRGIFYLKEGGLTESGKLSGDGYFLISDIYNICNADTIEIGVTNSENYNELDTLTFTLDNDLLVAESVLKFDNFSNQNIIVKVTKDNITRNFYSYFVKF